MNTILIKVKKFGQNAEKVGEDCEDSSCYVRLFGRVNFANGKRANTSKKIIKEDVINKIAA